ncbi:DgyrCDS8482 [Dimorphilus gyrociliatus]|uniref:Phosphatidylinositol-glycan-specific phospholipase D n=1 Tax=Dimorphilus gyrociliatus TaxID=2664684 RepID=A0A7I8VWL1_9ANNE|nr:DgyrCDS8482 [Dimorphilus gyrociliatus]
MRIRMNIHNIILLFSTFLGVSQMCGITTHIETGYRAKEYIDLSINGLDFKEIIEKHDDAFQAGCPFPDAMYPGLCYDGMFHSIAEDTHWTPIMNATINFLRNLPQPWTNDTEKFLSFILGIFQHQIADVNWHSLGITQGFIRTMSKVNYHNQYGPAHSDADFGGDVVNVYNLDTSYIDPTDQWYVPDKDMERVYEEFYGYKKVNSTVISDCAELLFLGRLGEHIGAIEVLYPEYAEASPFLVDEMSSFFLGGLDDMAAWVTQTWKRAQHMMEQGTDKCEITPEKDNPIHMRCPDIDGKLSEMSTVKDTQKFRDVPILESKFIKHFVQKYRNDIHREESERGTYFHLSPNLQKLVKKANKEKAQVKTRSSKQKDASVIKPNFFLTTNNLYSKLGSNIVKGDLNNDGFQDLVITAPEFSLKGNYQVGRVYILYGSRSGIVHKTIDIDNIANVTLTGSQENGRFGKGVAIVDLNADGKNDLAVSAPSVGLGAIQYQGEVYIFLGTDSAISEIPDITLKCNEKYCNMGEYLAAGDVDGDDFDDLIIGSPRAPAGGEQRGFVSAVLSNKALAKEKLDSFDIRNSLWSVRGNQDYEWFGEGVKVEKHGESTLLLIPSPTWRICSQENCEFDPEDIESVGRLTIFECPLSSAGPRQIINGTQKFNMLGRDIALGNPYINQSNSFLAVASPLSTIEGKIDDLPETFIQAGKIDIYNASDMEVHTTISGDREISRHGHTLLMEDINNDEKSDLIISSHLRSDDYDFIEGVDEGRIYIFLGGSSFPIGNFTQDCDDYIDSPCLKENADFILSGGEDKSRFSKAITVVGRGQKQLIVGMPTSNQGGRQSGKIAVFNFEI